MSDWASERLPLVGRETEKAIIREAVKAQDTVIVYLEGRAGTGKTMLLEEAERIARESAALCPPILDFYDTETHSHQGLEAAIALSLDPQKQHFAGYWRQREPNPQADLWDSFCEGYSAVAQNARIVLRFDTTERLAYERDSEEVLKDCGVEETAAPSWQWVLQRIGQLPNTAAVIAARPVAGDALRGKLKEAYTNRLFAQEIAGFTLPETQAYFEASEYGRQVMAESPDIVTKVHALAEGRPILIALALDWLQRGSWDQRTLETIQPVDFERVAVEQVRDLRTPLDKAVKYAALCRKGCNAELLRRLMQAGGDQVSQQEAGPLVEQLLALSFVKPPRPGSRGMFFLHDEMYDLVERYVWLPDWPDYREQARLDRVVIDWYTEQIEAYARRIREAGGWQAPGQLRREQQLLIAERLYYRFDADPRLGYREYSHLVEEAIARRELEWDTWLHNEAFWFMSYRAWRTGDPDNQTPNYPKGDPAWLKDNVAVHNPTVDHDGRRRWVGRYIARDRHSDAVRIVEKLLDRPPLPGEPELYRPGLRIALATAQAYLGGEHIAAAVKNFDEAFSALSKVPAEHREPWLYPYLAGSAHLYRGLALRGELSLTEAREAYSQAIRCFREIGYQPGLAEAANNLAYVLARQGRLEPALSTGNEALRIRQGLGDEYGIGLSLNTIGVIQERMAHPITAIARSEEALRIFEEIDNTRGTMLARVNLGRAYRRKARSPEWGQQDDDFAKGEEYLKAVVGRQDPDTDRFYQVEAHNELGCLYRDWVATLYEKGERNDRIPGFLDLAEKHLRCAVDLTADHGVQGMPHVVQHVDSLEDLARVYYWRARLEVPGPEGDPVAVMTRQLDRAEALAQRFSQKREENKLILGKVFFQRARLARLQGRPAAETGKHYGLAAGFTESYSLDAPEAHKFTADACVWLGELEVIEAEHAVKAMQDALQAAGLRSVRLRDSVENVVRPLTGVGWPQDSGETSNG